jgi:hypothetical protein
VQCQDRATPSGPIRFAIPRLVDGLASMSMSAPVTVAPRYKPPSFQRERSVALLAFLGNLAMRPSQRRKRKLCDFQSRFVCFGIGVMLAASANVIALLVQNVAIAHPKEAECRFARRLRTTGIGMGRRLAYSFRHRNDRGGHALENLVRSLDIAV